MCQDDTTHACEVNVQHVKGDLPWYTLAPAIHERVLLSTYYALEERAHLSTGMQHTHTAVLSTHSTWSSTHQVLVLLSLVNVATFHWGLFEAHCTLILWPARMCLGLPPFCTCPPLCIGALWPMPAWGWRDFRFCCFLATAICSGLSGVNVM